MSAIESEAKEDKHDKVLEAFDMELPQASNNPPKQPQRKLVFFAGFALAIVGLLVLACWGLTRNSKTNTPNDKTANDRTTSHDTFTDMSDDIPECRNTLPHVKLLDRNSKCKDIGLNEKSQPRITIASAFMGQYTELDFVWQNHLQYAKKHGYNYFAPVCNSAFQYGEFQRSNAWWLKFAIVKFLFDHDSQYVFWMDGDSVFTSMTFNLDRLLFDPPKDFVVSGDLNVVFNAGHFMIRNSSWSQQMMRDTHRICLAPNWHDNGAWLVYLGGGMWDERSTWQPSFNKMAHSCITEADAKFAQTEMPSEIQKHVQVLAQDEMNSYDGGSAPYIIHFAGQPFERKRQGLRERAATGDPVKPEPRYVYVDEDDNATPHVQHLLT